MKSVIDELRTIWGRTDQPFFIRGDESLSFSDVAEAGHIDLSAVEPGDVVALVGDFDAISVNTFLRLIDLRAVIVPLTKDTQQQHEAFLKSAKVDVVISSGSVTSRSH
jgi:hypothetical protein